MNDSIVSSKNQSVFKVVFIGDKAVGKTSIVKRYCDKQFSQVTESTIGASFFSHMIEINDENGPIPIKLQIWDTAGEEKFRSLTPMYYKNSAAVICVYDSTAKETFDSLTKWIKEIEDHRTQDVLLVLVSNKCDLEEYEEVSVKDGLESAKKNKAIFVQTSAKADIGIDELFESVALKLHQRK